MHAGLVPTKRDEGKLMFWLFEKNQPLHDDTLVVWFNGGPGCSSFHAGLFLEMGPVTTPLQPAGSFGQQPDAKYGFNKYAWANASAIMYVEQPVGTGFSYGSEQPDDEEVLSMDFFGFMTNFYDIFPKLSQKKLYLVGESYAGYYVPSIAHQIYIQNQNPSNKHINLAGIALGNGWADANIQGPAIIDYAWWHGMIDSVTRDAFHAEWEHCRLQTGREPRPFHPFTTPDECGMMESVLRAAGAGLLGKEAPNTYDVTTWDQYLLLTEPENSNAHFLNDPRVRKALNVPDQDDKEWTGCIPGAGRRRSRRLEKETKLPGEILLADDKPISMKPYLADLLDKAKINVLVYNGDRDLSTCAQGSEMMLDTMDWSGAEDWKDHTKYQRSLWMVNGHAAGYSKSVQNLQFVVVLNSGHLVPYNVPVAALDLVERLITGTPFGDVEIPWVFTKDYRDKYPLADAPMLKAGGGLVPFLSGILAGALLLYAYMTIKMKHSQRASYEPISGNGERLK